MKSYENGRGQRFIRGYIFYYPASLAEVRKHNATSVGGRGDNAEWEKKVE